MDVVGGGLSKLVKPIRLYVFQHSIRLLLLQDITKASSFAILQIRPSRLHLVKQRCKGLLLPSYKMSATTAGVRGASSRLGTCETLAKSCATILFLMMVSCCLGSNAQVPLDHLSHFNPCPFNPQCQCSTGGKQKHFIRRSLLLSKLFGFLLDGSHKSCTQIKINVELFEPQRKSEEGTFLLLRLDRGCWIVFQYVCFSCSCGIWVGDLWRGWNGRHSHWTAGGPRFQVASS